MLNDRMALHIGVGALSSGLGFEYYVANPRKQRFNVTAALYGSINYEGFPMIYVPLGIGYTGRKGFQYAINGGMMYCENVSSINSGKPLSPWFGLTIGKRFGSDVRTVKSVKPSLKRNSLSGRISMVYSLLGISYERYILPSLGIEASIGVPGASIGLNAYLPALKPGKVSLKLGVSQGVLYNPFEGIEHINYAAAGIQFLAVKGFIFSIDGGPQYFYSEDGLLPGFSIKFGKAF